MRRRPVTLLAAATLGGLLISVVVVATPAAGAAPPPMTGSVSCTLTAHSTFKPAIGYGRGRLDPNINPGVDAKWKVLGDLTGCTGTQTGGHPKRPGPITRGELLVKARAVDHACTSLSTHGMTVTRLRIRWFNAANQRVSTTKAAGTAGVTGLRNGSPYETFSPPVLHPDWVAPGIIRFNLTATATPTSVVFAGKPITMTTVADQTIESFQMPCSYETPPLTQGLGYFDFHAVNGPSTLSIG
jgi:hypothetical protein